ncbi:hypothetical protein [Brotaphodocola sp.]|uniref:hypothetical protein n=1 Tax=Brotaphodocola sp. TaxID=3073577 RepID=UPI003D7C4348
MNAKFMLPKIKNFLYCGVFILILKVYGSASSILPFYNDNIDTVLAILGVGCLGLHCIMMQYYNRKILLVYILVSLLALYSTIRVGNYGIFITAVTCLAIYGEDPKKVIEFIFKYECLFFVLHLIFAIIRIPFTGDFYSQIIDGVERLNMGFGHPNRFSVLVFNLLLMWIWLNFKNIKYINILIIFGISLINYKLTRTRTNETAILILLIVLLFYKHFPQKTSNVLRIVAMFITPVLSIISMLAVILYTKGNNIVLVALDKALSGRIRLGAYAYEHYGISFWGRTLLTEKIQYDETYQLNYFTFDNIYTDISMRQGIIWLILLIVLFYVLAKRKNDDINFAIIAWGIYGITEVHGLNVYMLFVVLLTCELFKKCSGIIENYNRK